jgi:MFS family permease
MEQAPRSATPNLFIISTLNFISFLDTTILIPIIALYATTLNVGPGTVGFIVGLYSIVNSPTNLFSGRLIDRIGYRIPLLIGMAGSAVCLFGYSLVRLPLQLGLIRALHGLFGGTKSPSMMSAFSAKADEHGGRGRTMAFYGMSIAFANLVGFGMSGAIVTSMGYPVLFYTGAGILTAGTLLSFLLPKLKTVTEKAPRLSPRQVFSRIGNLLKRKGLVLSYAAVFAQYFTFGGIVTLLPLYVKGLGMEAFHVGMLLTVYTVVFIAFQMPSGILSDRLGRKRLVYAGLVLGVGALVVLPQMKSFLTLALVMAVYGAAFGLLFPSVSALVVDHATPDERGLASGVFHALVTAGVALGAPILGGTGSLLGLKTGLTVTPAILALVLVVSVVFLRGPSPSRRET